MSLSRLLTDIKIQKQMVFTTALLLFIFVIFTLFFCFNQWRKDWLFAHQPITQAPMYAKTESIQELMTAIPNDHLFGLAISNNNSVNDMPISSLQLQVTGIIKLNDASSKILISKSGQPSKIYKIGDFITSGVKIHDVTADTVVFENNGRIEKLPLAREKLQFKARPTIGEQAP